MRPPEHSIARVLGKDQRPIGLAFLVGDRQLLTAAHVVNAALGRDHREAGDPGDATVLLEFPFGGDGDQTPVGRATVAAWGPGRGDFLTHDVAGLALGQAPPEGVHAVRLARDDQVRPAAVQMWGPSPDRRTPGHVSGELMGHVDKGRDQVDQVVRGAFAVGAGFSGGPVWVRDTGEVVGVLHAAADGSDVYVIRLEVAVECWPDQLYRPPPSPYPGLRSFGVSDAEFFFGRDTFVDELVADAGQLPIVSVMGASGCGKSSVVAAGLIARLGRRDPQTVIFVRPGDNVITALAAGIGRAVTPVLGIGTCRENLIGRGLATALDEVALSAGARRCVLVVDQLEQLLSDRHDPAERQQFVRLLGQFAERGASPSAVVALSIRNDFYGQLVTLDRRLGDYLQRHTRTLRQMTDDELRSAVALPARRVETERPVHLDDQLVDQIVEDFAGQAGDLPLVQFTLQQLWSRQRGRRLTLNTYRDIGGMREALVTHANECIDALDDAGQRCARYLFCRFTRTDLPGVGRPVRRAELSDQDWVVVGKLADAPCRLVRITRDTDGGDVVEIAHEILLRDWPRLRRWRDADAAFLTWLNRTEQARSEWIEHGDDSVLRGAALQRARSIAAEHAGEVIHLRDFLDRSAQLAEAEALNHDRAVRRRTRARRVVTAALATLVLLTSGAAVTAVRESASAAEQERLATGRALAAEAEAARGSDPASAIRLGVAAMDVNPSAETRASLIDTLVSNRYAATLPSTGAALTAVAMMPGRPVAVLSREDGNVEFWNVRQPNRPEMLSSFRANAGAVYSVAVTGDGRRLLTTGEHGGDLWAVDGHYRPRHLTGLGGQLSAVINGDGRVALYEDPVENAIQVWDLADPDHPRKRGRLAGHRDTISAFDLSSDGSVALTAAQDGTGYVWDITDPSHPVRRGVFVVRHNGAVLARLSGNGRLALVGDSALAVIDLHIPAEPRQIGTLPVPAEDDAYVTDAAAISSDGRTAMTAGSSLPARLWDLTDPRQPREAGSLGTAANPASLAALSQDGRFGLLGGGSTATLWTLEPPSAAKPVVSIKGDPEQGLEWLAPLPDGRTYLVAGRGDPTPTLWNLESPPAPRRVSALSGQDNGSTSIASASASSLAITSDERGAVIWDVADPAGPARAGMFSTDGAGFYQVAVDAQGMVALASSIRGSAGIWDISRPVSPRRVGEIRIDGFRAAAVAVSPDGRTAAVEAFREVDGDTQTVVSLWDIRSPGRPRQLATWHGTTSPLVFSSDNRYLVTGDDKDGVVIRDVSDPSKPSRLGSLGGHETNTFAAALSRDGRILVIGNGSDNNVSVWDIGDPRRPRRLAILIGHTNAIYSVGFGPSENTVLAGSPDGKVLVWDVSRLRSLVSDPHRAACAVVGTGLSEEQWRHYVPGLPYRDGCG